MSVIISLLSLLLLGAAVSGQRTAIPAVCYPTVSNECLMDSTADCPTCCCNSTTNTEFLNPDSPELDCSAVPAIYEVKFVSTWTETCQPDTNSSGSRWDGPIFVAHDASFRLWDACMDNVSPQIASFSTTGDPEPLINFLISQIIEGFIVDMPMGEPIAGGESSSSAEVVVDKYHPLVSVLARQSLSPDHVAGVADLILCKGDRWKERVRVCLELFSTAAASPRVAAEMQRNSLQGNSCSYGYIDLTLKETDEFKPRNSLPETCYPKVPEKCPPGGGIDSCSTCCCESSENIEFYDPDASQEPACTAPSPALYDVKFSYAWSQECHPDYYFTGQAFTNPVAVSHTPRYRMWDACMDDPSIGVQSIAENGVVSIVEQEYRAAGDSYLNSSVGELILSGVGSTSLNLTVDKNHQWVSVGLMLVPSPDRFLGVADLRMCNGGAWKERVKVCFELFSTATASERVAPPGQRNSLQASNCTFGFVEFNLLEPLTGSVAAVTPMSLALSLATALLSITLSLID